MTLQAKADSREALLFNETVVLLTRQQEGEDVTNALKESLARFTAVYKTGKCNFSLIQAAIGLASVGLGQHDEACSKLKNAVKIAAGDECIVNNAMLGMLHMGEVRQAHKFAVDASLRFAGHRGVLSFASTVLLTTLDMTAYAQNISDELKLALNEADVEMFVKKQASAELISEYFKASGYSHEDLMQRLESAVCIIREAGNNVHSMKFRATGEDDMQLELFVDADNSRCADLNFEIAECLLERFEGRAAQELISIVTRVFKARVANPRLAIV